MNARWIVAAALAVGLAVTAEAQQKPTLSVGKDAVVTLTPAQQAAMEKLTTPVLGDLQKLQIQVLVQKIEIAQLRAQAAQEAFERAREEITKLVQSLQVPGYDLSLERLEYVKKPELPKKEDPR